MTILILNWRDSKHPLAGGAEQSLFEHAKYWQRKGAKIIWFSSAFHNAPAEETYDNIRIIRRGSHFTVHLHAFFYYKKNLKNNIDIVIDNFHFIPYFSPLYVKKEKILAFINEPARNAWFKNIFFPVSFVGYIAEPFFFRFYERIPFMTGARSIQQELIKYKVPQERIFVINHGVTLPVKKGKMQKEKNPTMLFLAQLAPDKGILDALEAFYFVKEKLPFLTFWIVGKAVTPTYLQVVKKKIKAIDPDGKRITLFGFVDAETKFSLLERAWVLVHPSVREGWGLNVIEANSVGTPAIGYNVTGLQDSIQDGKTGLLTKENSPMGLADAIERMVLNKPLYTKLASQTKQWAEQFTWEKAGEKSWSLIQRQYEKTQ